MIIIRKRTGGRNNQGKITAFHRGGGARRYIRTIDFKRERYDAPARVLAIEYDPNRSANIALVEYEDKERRYILAPDKMVVGDTVVASRGKVAVQPGNRTILANIPVGEMLHDIELNPGAGGKLVRGAGMGAMLLAIEGNYAQIRLPSGETRMFLKGCSATIGVIGNSEHRLVRVGKAGKMRHMGIKPTVRGKAKNPVDHHHGGGEGHNPIGMKRPKTPWGKPALGVKTRRKNKFSERMILQRRKKR